jgi:hypothetical protein
MVAIGVYLAENLGHFRRERSYWDYKVEQSLVARPPEVPIPDVHDLERLEDRQLWERFSRFAILVRPYWGGRLARDTDRHLVVVRYAENSNRHREWVYNRADIDGSKTIWARWRDDEPLWPLLAYYRDRRVWLIEPEREPWRLSRFPLEEVPPWHLREHEGARGRIELAGGDGDGARLEVLEPGAQRYQLQAEHAHPKLRAGRTYLGGFRARADAPRTLSIGVTQALYPWEGLGLRRGIRLGTDWRTYSWGFRANADYGAPRLLVNFGGEPAGIEIADVRLEEEPVAEGRADAR